MNLLQESIRWLERRLRYGVQRGREGSRSSRSPASLGVRSALRALHATHARTQFSQDVAPPRERGRGKLSFQNLSHFVEEAIVARDWLE